jgi:hypothetical protein
MANPLKAALKRAYFSRRLNPHALRLYSALRPPPFRRDDMEFAQDVWNGICTFRSTAGRQIGENNTGPDIYKATVETEHKICKFEGSRYGLPINVTALREVMGVWDDALQFTTLLRQRFMARHGLTDPRFNLRQGYVFSKAGAAIPAYQARRAERPLADGTLPPLETAFFTLGVGPFMVVRALMERGDLRAAGTEPHSAEALYELADTSGSIVSAGGKGCAGSKKLFLDFLDAAMNGTYAKPLNSAEARRAIDSVGDWDAFFDYLYASARLELLIKVAQALSAQALLIVQADGRHASDALDAVLARCQVTAGSDTGADSVQSRYFEVLLHLLDELGGPPVRARLEADGLLMAAQRASSAEAAAQGRLAGWAARQITGAMALLGALCREESVRIAQALGLPGMAVPAADDLWQRVGGDELRPLLRRWEG